MTFEELEAVCDGGKDKATKIFELTKDIHRYEFFKRSQDLGIVYGKRDLSFTDFLLFSYIKEKISVGKTRV